MRRWIGFLCALVLILSIVGCGSSASPSQGSATQSNEFPLTITDDAQRSVTINKEPQRIISLAPSSTEFIYALDLQDRLVGVDDYSNYPPEAKNKEKVGGYSDPNLEKIVSLNPDLALASTIHVKTLIPELEKRGIKAIVFEPATVDRVLDNLQLLGKVAGQAGAADKTIAELRQRIEAVASKTKGLSARTRVFMELSPDLISVGRDTFLDDMISKAGGDNVARDAQGPWPKLNPESVVLKDPEIILLSDMGTDQGGVTIDMVKARPGWTTISAVKNGRIVPIEDTDIVNRSSPRAVDGLEFLARTIHPELFK